tara:strand:- start:116 stop:358 length:243 start_codon:yes stop_codon:yes gene_type:complete
MKKGKKQSVKKKKFSFLQQQWLDIHKRNIENGKEMNISVQKEDGSVKRLKWSDIPLGLMKPNKPNTKTLSIEMANPFTEA